MTTPLLFNQLDPVDYLELLQRTVCPEKLRPLLTDIDEGLQVLSSDDRTNSRLFISRVAAQLRLYPKLLHQFNCLINPRFRLECSTNTQQVDHFVLVDQDTCNARIISLTDCDRALPSSSDDVLNLISDTKWWQDVLIFNPDKGWLECVAQLVQEISNNPSHAQYQQLARKRLRHLSKASIVNPSLFIHSTTTGILRRSLDDPNASTYAAGGAFCDVHKLLVKEITLCFRVLRQAEDTDKEKLKADFCRELIIWQQLSHPNIIPLLGANQDASPGCFSFVLPWMPHGSIMSYLKKEPGHDKFRAICEVADGIEYLHKLNVSHKDIKGDNILVRADSVCVLTDFGLASCLDSQRSKASHGCGSLSWMAPELIFPPEDENIPVLGKDSRPRDVYSFGCTIAEILTGAAPKFIMWSMLQRQRPSIPPLGHEWTHEEADLWFLVEQCIQAKPEDRPPIRLVRTCLEDIRKVHSSSDLPALLPTPNPPPDIPVIRNWLRRQLHRMAKPKPHRLHLRGLFTPITPNHPVVIDLDSSDESSSTSPTLRVRSTSRRLPLPATPRIPLARFRALPTPPDTPAPPSPGTPASARLMRPMRRPSFGRLDPTSRKTREPTAQPASPLRQAHRGWTTSIIHNEDQNIATARSGLSRLAS